MMNYFTKEEKILCAFVALYDNSISIDDIEIIKNRSKSSIKMKIQNYAALFDYKNIKRNPKINPLSGKTTGKTGRMTDWETIEPLTKIGKASLLNKCKEIIKENINNQKTEIEQLEDIIKNLTEIFKIIIKEELIKIVELNNKEWAITTTKNKIRIHLVILLF